jgi:hypothetical protein
LALPLFLVDYLGIKQGLLPVRWEGEGGPRIREFKNSSDFVNLVHNNRPSQPGGFSYRRGGLLKGLYEKVTLCVWFLKRRLSNLPDHMFSQPASVCHIDTHQRLNWWHTA